MASAMRSAWRTSLLGLADQRAEQRPDVQHERGPAGLVAQRLAEQALAAPRRRQQQHAAGPGRGLAAAGARARVQKLEGVEPAQVGERLAAAVQREQARLLEHARLQLPHRFGLSACRAGPATG